MLCMDDMVPQNHMLRLIDKAIDWTFIYELVEEKYCPDNGRPSMDPVMLIKIPFIQYLYGIKSMRQTIKEIEVNVAYRWFLGLDMLDPVPHFSTFGKNYTRRFKDTDLFEQIFAKINAVPVIRKAAGSVKASINMFSPMQWKQLVINTAGSWDTAFIRGMNMTAGHSKHFMTR